MLKWSKPEMLVTSAQREYVLDRVKGQRWRKQRGGCMIIYRNDGNGEIIVDFLPLDSSSLRTKDFTSCVVIHFPSCLLFCHPSISFS